MTFEAGVALLKISTRHQIFIICTSTGLVLNDHIAIISAMFLTLKRQIIISGLIIWKGREIIKDFFIYAFWIVVGVEKVWLERIVIECFVEALIQKSAPIEFCCH